MHIFINLCYYLLKMKDIKKKAIIAGGIFLASMLLVFYLGSFVVPKALITLTKASGSAKVSGKNSFLLGEKILARADGEDKCVVNVFVLDADGKGMANKQVQLSGLGEMVGMTNSLGKASFELTSRVAKQYELMASINGEVLGKTLKVTFR
jgi:hypothetical protein